MTQQVLNLDDPKAGLYFDISFEDYVEIKAVNNSTLKYLIDQTPAHCKQYIEEGRPETGALFFGAAADCYILEPSLFAKKYAVGPDARRNSKIWKEFEASVEDGVICLKPPEMADIISIANKVNESGAIRLIQGGQSQVVCIWQEPLTGLTCKARWDYWQEQIPMITDMKTTRSAAPDSFAKDIFKFGYYMQAAFYCDGYKFATGDDTDPCFAFFAAEKTPPFVCAAYELGDKSLLAGQMSYQKAIKRYAKCLETDEWPAYSEKITLIEMPSWALVAAGFGEDMLI